MRTNTTRAFYSTPCVVYGMLYCEMKRTESTDTSTRYSISLDKNNDTVEAKR